MDDLFQLTPQTDEQYQAGALLSYDTKIHIKNLMVAIARAKLTLVPESLSPEGKETYWQQAAYLRGQFDILETLLRTSDELSQP